MRTFKEFKKRLKQYDGAKYIYTKQGLIAWQVSTGENVELLFIEVSEPNKGYGTSLIKQMCSKIKPFNSVFVFRLASNKVAGKFYRKLGFKEQRVSGLYKQGAVLGIISYKKLCRYLSIK